MKRTMALMFAAAAIASGAAEKISYSGSLAKADCSAFSTTLPITMTFRLYDQATGGGPLWGRTMPVMMSAKGDFYVELADDAGSAVAGSRYLNLDVALAAARDGLWIGVSPESYSEMLPRQEIMPVPRALRATTARRTETLKADAVNGEMLDVTAADVGTLKATGSFVPCKSIDAVVAGERVIRTKGQVMLSSSISGIRMDYLPSDRMPNTAPCDMFVILPDAPGTPGGYSSLVFPCGAKTEGVNSGKSFFANTFGKGLAQ